MKKPSSFFILGVCMILWSYNHSGVDAYIGINWGRLSSQRLIPSMVVDLLLQNQIKHVRIFQQSANVMEAFCNSRIRVTIGITNTLLDRYTNESTAQWWIDEKITKYENVMDFGYVTIGSNPFTIYPNGKLYFNVVDAVRNMQNQLNNNSKSYIKAATLHSTDVLNLTSTSKPSEIDFRADIKEKMVEYVRLLRENESPFLLTVYPIDFVNTYNLDLEFAFMDNKSTHRVQDINATYTNAFELLYDSLHWALNKAGVGTMEIVIGSIGWPTDSYRGASAENAERFYKNFLPYIVTGRGTPMRPNQNIDVYLNTLSDENRMLPEWGLYQRHWGIYKFNGEPKYRIDLSGQGRDILPSTAKGVTQMPNRWCVFNKKLDNPKLVEEMRSMACNASDCSSLEEGGSCNSLSYEDKISYAFNRYFQTNGQASQSSDEKCYLGGLGMVVTDNPSEGECEFPVEILSAEYTVEGETFGTIGRAGEIAYGWISASTGLLVLLVLRIII